MSAFGAVSGVQSGAIFHRREDLRASGIHRQPWRGIDWTDEGALAVVFSGGYRDDAWDVDAVWYTGEGGQGGHRKQVRDQRLIRGNRALRNNIDKHIPIRVARRVKQGKDFSYRYEGLFDVVECRLEASKDGPKVYRFRLVRLGPD
jgi:hypothetical protein